MNQTQESATNRHTLIFRTGVLLLYSYSSESIQTAAENKKDGAAPSGKHPLFATSESGFALLQQRYTDV